MCFVLWTFSCVCLCNVLIIWGGFLCCTRVEESGRTTSVSNLMNQYCVCSQNRFGLFTQCCLYPSHACYFHILTFLLSFSLMGRSLVEDDDAQMMKVSLGCSEMGLSSQLAGLKNRKHTLLYQQHTQLCGFTGECVWDYICLLLNVRVGMWGVTICHSGIISHVRVCVCVFGRDCEGHLCCFWQSGFSSHIKMIILWSSSLVVGSVLPEVQENIH